MEWHKEKMMGWNKYSSGDYTIEKEDDHDCSIWIYSVWFQSRPIGSASSVALAKQVAFAHAAKEAE